MKNKKDPKDDKPKPVGTPPPTETIRPKPVNDEVVSFSYNDMVFEDFFYSGNRRFVRFFIDVEKPYYCDLSYGEYIEMQLFIWETQNKIVENSKEGEFICTCNKISPEFEKVDTITLTFTAVDEENKEFEIKEVLDVYVIYNILEGITVGGICKVDDKIKKK